MRKDRTMEFARGIRVRRRGLSLTSLIDVVFLLVIFFMLASKYITYEFVQLKLSTVQSQDIEKSRLSNQVVIITLAADQKFIIEGRYYTEETLIAKLKPMMHEGRTPLSIVLDPGKTITVQEVMTSMQQLKKIGIKNISLVE